MKEFKIDGLCRIEYGTAYYLDETRISIGGEQIRYILDEFDGKHIEITIREVEDEHE